MLSNHNKNIRSFSIFAYKWYLHTLTQAIAVHSELFSERAQWRKTGIQQNRNRSIRMRGHHAGSPCGVTVRGQLFHKSASLVIKTFLDRFFYLLFSSSL